MSKHNLYIANIRIIPQQICCETVAHGVRVNWHGDAGATASEFEYLLYPARSNASDIVVGHEQSRMVVWSGAKVV
jgi:hypothetical protein